MKIHILLIDDDKDELLIFNEAIKQLTAFDCKVTYASSSDQALEMLQHIHPHFILVDFNMPRQNGLDFIKASTSVPAVQTAVMYLISTHISHETERMCRDYGVKDCLTKTSSVADLVAMIRSIFSANHLYITSIANAIQ